jgi:hypothetical protein
MSRCTGKSGGLSVLVSRSLVKTLNDRSRLDGRLEDVNTHQF